MPDNSPTPSEVPQERPPSELRIQWDTIPADEIIGAYVKGYVGKPEHHEWFYDATKRVFILKLYQRVAL